MPCRRCLIGRSFCCVPAAVCPALWPPRRRASSVTVHEGARPIVATAARSKLGLRRPGRRFTTLADAAVESSCRAARRPDRRDRDARHRGCPLHMPSEPPALVDLLEHGRHGVGASSAWQRRATWRCSWQQPIAGAPLMRTAPRITSRAHRTTVSVTTSGGRRAGAGCPKHRYRQDS
jgi:hypothetical protein